MVSFFLHCTTITAYNVEYTASHEIVCLFGIYVEAVQMYKGVFILFILPEFLPFFYKFVFHDIFV